VFLSGTSAALAYSAALAGPRLWPVVSRIWGRAWTLYMVHILITVWALGIAAATLRLGGAPALISQDNMQYLAGDMAGVLTGLPLMMHQWGYVNILPLYAALLLATPWLILVMLRWPRLLLAGSVLLWAAAGQFQMNLPNFPTAQGWFFNPFAWQLLFVLGLLTGLALKRGARFVPRDPRLVALSVAVLVVALLWLKWPGFGDAGNAVLGKLAAVGVPPWIRDFDKTGLAAPRLLHVLALVYLVSVLTGLQRLCASRWLAPLATLGRQALPVFALGTVLAFLGRAVLELGPASPGLDAAVILAGLTVLWLFADLRERSRLAAT